MLSVGGDSITLYPHIEFSGVSGVLSPGGTITGVSGATLTVLWATGREAHGTVGGTPPFVVGEALSGTGGWTAICSRPNTGCRFSHAVGTRVVEVTDAAEDGALLCGNMSVSVSEAGDWASGNYMCIGYGSPYAEVRVITLTGPSAAFSQPLSYDHGHFGGLCKVDAAGGIYTHMLCETREIPPIQIAADYTDVDGAASLMRRYAGVKGMQRLWLAEVGEDVW